jgi:predicted O-methyltransferase YrrM
MLQAMNELVAGISSQSELLSQKFADVVAGIDNQTDLLNRKFEELHAGVDNQTNLLNRKFDQLFVGEDNQTDLINKKFGELIAAFGSQRDGFGRQPSVTTDQARHHFEETEARQSLMLDERTFNANHSAYSAKLVRNYPGKIFNLDARCTNSAFGELTKQAEGDQVPDGKWNKILGEALVEAASAPGAAQVFERQNYIENYMAELGRRYNASYMAGSVNLDNALFLYWLVRQAKPRTIVQCGACNGLSSAFMMLALAKNGPEGTLSIIDLPQVFDPDDSEWTKKGKTYGECIPEGKTTAWMVPDIYRDRLKVWNGNVKDLLSKMVDGINSIDLFFHDSDHTYGHMMAEFQEVKRKLAPGGLIVANDISWNSSLWDFADSHDVPAYNFKGIAGASFF